MAGLFSSTDITVLLQSVAAVAKAGPVVVLVSCNAATVMLRSVSAVVEAREVVDAFASIALVPALVLAFVLVSCTASTALLQSVAVFAKAGPVFALVSCPATTVLLQSVSAVIEAVDVFSSIAMVLGSVSSVVEVGPVVEAFPSVVLESLKAESAVNAFASTSLEGESVSAVGESKIGSQVDIGEASVVIKGSSLSCSLLSLLPLFEKDLLIKTATRTATQHIAIAVIATTVTLGVAVVFMRSLLWSLKFLS